MSAATSPGTGLAYGLRRVCAAWGMARRPLRRPAADLHGACRAVWLDRGRRGSGAPRSTP